MECHFLVLSFILKNVNLMSLLLSFLYQTNKLFFLAQCFFISCQFCGWHVISQLSYAFCRYINNSLSCLKWASNWQVRMQSSGRDWFLSCWNEQYSICMKQRWTTYDTNHNKLTQNVLTWETLWWKSTRSGKRSSYYSNSATFCTNNTSLTNWNSSILPLPTHIFPLGSCLFMSMINGGVLSCTKEPPN